VLYPLSYEGIVPICRDFTSATAGPEYQSCEKVAKSAENPQVVACNWHGLGPPDRLIAWDDEDEGWSLDVWAIGADGDEGWTRVVILAAMLDDPKAAAYLEIVLEGTLG
jgi:hypothetical protein